ncbi:AAA family ATPase [Bavariicoccus seileri]|uniref:AAA family ATPase n=1 Tax=Bavariicoccus seileri TaxID=549685 RepID=UPI0003B596A1|nr:AAA family ATPase [Bavariicoccus seileri]
MTYKFKEAYIEKFRKLNQLNTLYFGSNITMLSGHNGVGKSSLLSLFASLSGTSDKRIDNQSFQPEFTDYFLINPEEKFSEYSVVTKFFNEEKDFDFYKRVSFNDYRDSNRGIRPIPRITKSPNSNELIKTARLKVKENLGLTDSSRIPIPSIYVSLARLLPPGESDIKTEQLSKNTNVYQNKYFNKYKEWYNVVIPGSIDTKSDDIETLTKNVTKSSKLYMPLVDSFANTQSVGQDNLGSIISSLIDFYSLSLKKGYNGGCLFIDEIEAALHPSAAIKLLDLLIVLSGELNLQIFFTSHSLILLKQMIDLQNNEPKKYRLNYLKGIRDPYLTSYHNYNSLKSDLFDDISSIAPKVKVYCEDEQTVWLFNYIINLSAHDKLKISTLSLNIMPIFLGCDQLQKLPNCDTHFKKVLIILDGDAKSKEKITIEDWIKNKEFDKGKTPKNFKKNIVALPSYLPPEGFLYTVIYDYCKNYLEHRDFWRSLDRNPDTSTYTSERVESKFLVDNENLKLDYLKSIWKDMILFAEKTQILKDYFNKNTVQLESFIKQLNEALNHIEVKNKATQF